MGIFAHTRACTKAKKTLVPTFFLDNILYFIQGNIKILICK